MKNINIFFSEIVIIFFKRYKMLSFLENMNYDILRIWIEFLADREILNIALLLQKLDILKPLRKIIKIYNTDDYSWTDTDLEDIATLTDLTYLYIKNCEMLSNELMFPISRMSNLKTLKIIYDGVTTNESGPNNCGIGLVHTLSNLQRLELVTMDNLGEFTIQGICQLSNLQELIIDSCDDILDGVWAGNFAKLKNLKTLKLSNISLKNFSFRYIPENLRNITHLDLSVTDIRTSNLNYPGFGSNIKILKLSNCPSIDETFLTYYTNLTELDLSYNKAIVDLSLPVIAGITFLEKLNLSGTRITNDGLKLLKYLTNLKELRLYRTSISKDGINLLKTWSNLEFLF